MRRVGALATFALLSAVVGAVYARALDAPFVFDDRPAIVENASLRRLWPLVGTADARGPLNPPPLAPTARRPFANLTLALDYQLYGLEPRGFRLTNLVLHALAAAILAALVRRTLVLPYFAGAFDEDAAAGLGIAAAVLFALHPLATEAVAYVTQRTELLAAVCYLGTLWAAIRYFDAATRTAAGAWIALAAAIAIAGIASKEVVVSVPLAVWLYEVTFRAGHPRATRRSWRLYVGLALSSVVLVALNLGGAPGLRDARHHVAPAIWWLTQTRVAFLYLKLVLWPWPLAIHYAPTYVDGLADAWPWLVAFTLLVGAIAAAVRRRPAVRWVAIVIAFVLAPTFAVPLPKMMAAERRMYLPLAGLATLAVVGGWRALAPRPARARVATSAVLALALVYAAVDVHRLAAYESVVSIWEDTIRSQPADAMAQYNLGVAYVDAHRPPDEAIARFEEAIRLDPAHVGAHDNLGMVLSRLRRYDEARRRFEEALALDPNDAIAENDLGSLLFKLGRPAEALPHLEAALAHEPDLPKGKVHSNLGAVLVELGRPAEALPHLDEALRLTPGDADALYNRGTALLALGRYADAASAFAAALERAPDDPGIEKNLATALLQADRIDDAVIHLEHVLARAPGDVGARNNLGTALRTLGRSAEAMAQFEAALARDPESVTAHFNLGSALLDGGRPADAVPHFEAVLRRAPDDAQARFTYAIALVQSGRREEAVAAAERALATARARGADALAADIDTWLASYRARPAG